MENRPLFAVKINRAADSNDRDITSFRRESCDMSPIFFSHLARFLLFTATPPKIESKKKGKNLQKGLPEDSKRRPSPVRRRNQNQYVPAGTLIH